MTLKLTPGFLSSALIMVLAAWVLHGFIEALLAACVIAVASWPLYRWFAARMPRRVRPATISLAFTAAMALFVLTPLVYVFVAFVTEVHATLLAVAAADQEGGAPHRWFATCWTGALTRPGALAQWAERADSTALLSWAQSLVRFTIRHLFIVVFTILVLFFLYREGESLAGRLRGALHELIGERAERLIDVAGNAVRAAVNSMLLVGLFDGCAAWACYAAVGVPQAALWAAITGALGLVPFAGYVAVGALTLQLSLAGAAGVAAWALALGGVVLFLGDKLVRPAMVRKGTQMPYVWVLMGCLGGFKVLGLVGLVIGPVTLSLARELLEENA